MYNTIVVIRRHDGNHKARKTRAGSEVKPIPRIGSVERELSAIREMAMPDLVQCGGSHKIDRLLPLAQQSGVGFKAILRFM